MKSRQWELTFCFEINGSGNNRDSVMTAPGPHPELKGFSPVEPREKAFALAIWSPVAGEALKPEIEAVERYFGGNGYSADTRTRDKIQDAIDRACRIVSPRMAFAIMPVLSANPDGASIHFSGGQSLPVPDCARNSTARFLAAAIGTLGKALENECRLLAAQHHIYQSTLLDSVGTAMLDALDTEIRGLIDAECRLRGLFSGVRFAPGLNGYALDHQQTLFQLADGLSVDVSLNEAFMMEPVKTISFFSLIGGNPVENKHPEKCLNCRLPHCQYRIGPSSATDAGMHRDISG